VCVLVSLLFACVGILGTNKWYQSCTAVLPDLPPAMAPGSETADSSSVAGAAQPRQEVVVHTVREVSGISWPMLTRTNYGEWAVTMKVKLRARRL